MGINLRELITKKEIGFNDLENKKLVVDSFNVMYQFLTTIRMKDGQPLKDSHGNVTSHLNGIFFRTTNLMQYNMKLAFVFDGKPPELKFKEIEKRSKLKEEAKLKYEKAKQEEDIDAMKKYAGRTSRLTKEMIEEAKELIKAMGLPVIQAPSEGEAQAAHIVNKGEAFAEISEDFDCLLYRVPRLIKNLAITQKRKKLGAIAYETVKPSIIDLKENLKALDINQEQLIVIGILIGTDYNNGGVKGIGPKNALKLVKQYKHDFDGLFREVKWDEYFDFSWYDIYELFKKMPVNQKSFRESQ